MVGMLKWVSVLFYGTSVLNFLKLVFLDAQSWTSNLPKWLWWVFTMGVRKVFKMYKRGKILQKRGGKGIYKDTNRKIFESYLGWVKFSISLPTWTYPASSSEGALLIFTKSNSPFSKHLSRFADNITLTPTYAHHQASEKLQFDTSVPAVSFYAFHQLLWDIFLCTRNYLHQKCVF